jgi:hypothetical protein
MWSHIPTITKYKMNQSKKNLIQEHPWVKVDPETYQILRVGTFQEINDLKIVGHTMTLSIYNQIIEERYDLKTIQ